MEVPPLPDGCPWSAWMRPNIDWCEQNLCASIVNPANTWSNVAYLIVGAAMLWSLRRHADPVLRSFGWVAIVVGLFSGIYHASYTYFFQFFDFVAMFMFAFLPIVMNLRRLGAIERDRQLRWYTAGVVVMSGLVPICFAIGFPIQLLVAALIVVIIGQEILLRARRVPSPPLRLFLASLGVLAAAAVCSALDLSRVWCDPDQHVLQGHAVWHVLSATALWVLSLFYRAEESGPESRAGRTSAVAP